MYSKLIYSLIAVAAFSATSCTSDSADSEAPVEGSELKFQTRADTRAAISTNSSIKEDPFAVYGTMTPTATLATSSPSLIFNGTGVAFKNGKWQYDDTKYWFPNQTYSFVASHPAPTETDGISNIEYNDNQLSFTYTLPADYHQATDLLIATHARRFADGDISHPVAFNFQHILSRLNFVANIDQALGAGNSVVIEHIALRNICNSAKFSVAPAPLTTSAETDDYIGTGWTDHSNADAILFEMDLSSGTPMQAGDRHELFPATGNQSLFVIPQLLTSDVSVELTYHTVINGVPQSPKTTTGNLYSISLSTPGHGGRWAAGQSYSYSFSLGVDDRIIFSSSSIQDWDPAEGATYIITD